MSFQCFADTGLNLGASVVEMVNMTKFVRLGRCLGVTIQWIFRSLCQCYLMTLPNTSNGANLRLPLYTQNTTGIQPPLGLWPWSPLEALPPDCWYRHRVSARQRHLNPARALRSLRPALNGGTASSNTRWWLWHHHGTIIDTFHYQPMVLMPPGCNKL